MKFLVALFLIQILSVSTLDAFAEQLESLKAIESPMALGPSPEELREMELKRQEKEKKRKARIQKRMTKMKKLEKEMVHADGIILSFTNRMEDMELGIEKLNTQENQARLKLHDKLELFNATARQIARLERLPLEAMAAATSLRAGYDRKSVVESGRKSLSGLIQKNRDDIYEIQEIRMQRQGKKNEVDSLRYNLLSERGNLQKLYKKQVDLLALDDREKAKLVVRANRMKQEKTIATLLERHANSDHYLPPVRHNLKKLPVKGQLIKGYNEKTGVGIYSQGITIETTAKEPVVSIKDGRVIYSDIFRDYGYMVIVEHADGSHTLYSGLDRSNRAIGYFASAGSIIGHMPKKTKPELYLEVRKNGKTLNPITHLSLNESS